MHENGVAPPDFAEFYRAEAAAVRRFMTAYAGLELGPEATAEGFARMLEHWPRLRALAPPQRRAYVMTTAKRYAQRRVEALSRLQDLPEDEWHEIGAADAALERIEDSVGLEEAVRALIDGLPPRRRQVAWLYFLADYGYAEIAGVLEISESTVRSHVGDLRRILQPYVRRFQQTSAEAREHDRA